jgi:hypothetical protein
MTATIFNLILDHADSVMLSLTLAWSSDKAKDEENKADNFNVSTNLICPKCCEPRKFDH